MIHFLANLSLLATRGKDSDKEAGDGYSTISFRASPRDSKTLTDVIISEAIEPVRSTKDPSKKKSSGITLRLRVL